MGGIEIWKPIDNRYSVSNYGRVRNNETRKILKPRKNSRGYFRVYLYLNEFKRDFFVHKLVANAFLGKRPKGYVINHLDGDKQNNCVWNLEYCTQSENMKHFFKFISKAQKN